MRDIPAGSTANSTASSTGKYVNRGPKKKKKKQGTGTSGKTTEATVEALRLLGFTPMSYKTFKSEKKRLLFDMPRRTLVTNFRYKGLHHEFLHRHTKTPDKNLCKHEFVIFDGGRRVVVECKHQDSEGSVDEKVAWILHSWMECQISNVWLVMFNGSQWLGKARALACIDWLEHMAERHIARTKVARGSAPKEMHICRGISEWYALAEKMFSESKPRTS